jgi:hypothetical protein
MLDVASSSKGVLVPRMTAVQKLAITSPATGLMIFQTDGVSGFFYYTGSTWSAVGGGALPSGTNGQVLQVADGSPTWVGSSLVVGESYGGGKIAYILQPGDPGYSALEQHGLIAATSDQSTGILFGCGGTNMGAVGFLIGSGRYNTEAIHQNCVVMEGAATVCRNYAGGGFTDWYLPNKAEINKLYINRIMIGGFESTLYWSSSEFDGGYAWEQDFETGLYVHGYKTDVSINVRAVRSF